MSYDPHDTIVAIASAPGGAARGIVRLSGPCVGECLAACFVSDGEPQASYGAAARRIPGMLRVLSLQCDAVCEIPGALFLWPSTRSFTRQPAAEFHTFGSPPLLAAIVEELCRHGARPAEPGEFTMRAFLAGRIDLTQAEAVLGVVDARTRDDLDGALAQLAGGLSRPLAELREQLLSLLAEVEAGLDFPDERLETAARETLREKLLDAAALVASTVAQLTTRDRTDDLPRIVLVGAPNVGKSSLFNALVARFGVEPQTRSIVSPTPGATRDYVTAQLNIGGTFCELVDAAGDDAEPASALDQASQQAAASQRRRADLRLRCSDDPASIRQQPAAGDLHVLTKCDLAGQPPTPAAFSCSSVTGDGLDELAHEIRALMADSANSAASGSTTAARCGRVLREASLALAAAGDLTRADDDELLAAELRFALNALGEAVGAVCADDVLDRVFSQFCIGK